MLFQRTTAPTRALLNSLSSYASPSPSHLTRLAPVLPILTTLQPQQTRHASHASQGRANGAKNGPGKRLGAKKGDLEYVVPGNIIFRQRGTHWFAGDNCDMGRDHTIFATQPGYVKYYSDPERHPKRKYIGVVLKRDDILPLPRNAARRRRLGMVAVQRDLSTVAMEEESSAGRGGLPVAEPKKPEFVVTKTGRWRVKEKPDPEPELKLRPGYMYRQGNWEIGRAAERAKVKVRPFKPGDRFAAWRKTVARKARNAEKRGLRKK